ncbi:MAG: helix-turn-helix domain-containing protein, partial [Pseudonocardia sp.]
MESASELAVLKRALGAQLAASRQAVEIGQQQVAHKTGYSRSSVAHAEAGRQLLTRDFWKTVDELVKAEGALLAGYERVQAVKQEQERRSREAELVGAFAMTGGFRQEDTGPLDLACASPMPSSDAVVVASQDAWRAVRGHLIRHRTQLAKQAARLYHPAWRLTHTPGLAPPSWLPSHPVPIETVTLEWVSASPRPAITGREAELRPVLPLRAPGHAFLQYT